MTGLTAITVVVVLLAVPAVAQTPVVGRLQAPADKYVRVANNYMRAGTDITPEVTAQLAKYDLVVLPAEAQNFNPALFAELRRLNPGITVLAYVPTKSFNFQWWTDALHQKLLAGIDKTWWLTDDRGNPISVWPGTQVINTVSPWQNYLPEYVKNEIMSTGKWDGVFYDELSANASWMNDGNIDLHRSGARTPANLLDTAWQRATVNMLRRTRELLGADAVIVTNGDSTAELQPYVNGRMFEAFPTPWEAGGTWSGVMANYINLHEQVAEPPVLMINAVSSNAGDSTDYRKMRFSLASTLLGDGFFGFDSSMSDHGQLWWYDEYDARLGQPLSGAMNLLAPYDNRLRDGVWRRDFENGVVLVNSTGQPRTVSFGEELERLQGAQDRTVNSGLVATSVTVPASDGLILIKRLKRITDAAFSNGGFLRFFDQDGKKLRNGFFAYERPFEGGANIFVGDVNGDGQEERVVAAQGVVNVYDAKGYRLYRFEPFGPNYRGSVNIAVADLDGNGTMEVISGAGPGGGPHVIIHAHDGRPLHPGFFPFDKKSRGGVWVATADLYGTGKPVIIVGSGEGTRPEVKVYSRFGWRLAGPYLAYDHLFRGGVRVAATDLDHDGRAEIITGAGPGGGPQVRTFSAYWKPLGNFMATVPSYRGGVFVTAGDLDGDGQAEIGTLTADVFQTATVQ
jgi:hypothetical protein